MKKYDEINFKGLDWYVLDTNEDKTKLLLKNVLDEERIKKYADDDFMINGHDVRHQDNIRPFDWDKSYIKNVILPNFIKDLGIECEVDLLSKEEAEGLTEEIRECDDWYWTKTPYSSSSNFAWNVNSSGFVNYGNNVYSANGVRPVLVISTTLLVSEDEFIDIEEIILDNGGRIISQYADATHYVTTNIKDREVYVKLINDLIKNQKKIIERLNNERD